MYRCKDCDWFVPRKGSLIGYCIRKDKKLDFLTKRCKDDFEKRGLT